MFPQEATCTEAGYTGDRVCTICGETVERGRSIAAKGHEWDSGVVSGELNEDGDAVRIYTCRVCGEKKTEVVRVSGDHKATACVNSPVSLSFKTDREATFSIVSGNDSAVSFTLTGYSSMIIGGYGTYVYGYNLSASKPGVYLLGIQSSYSSSVTTFLLVVTDHDWGEWTVTTPAAEDAEGVETRTCSLCGKSETRAIPALEHVHALTAVARVDAACSTPGTEAYWKCGKCGKLFSDAEGQNEIPAPVVIPALGHDVELKNAKAATCTEAGYTGDEVCKVCGETVKQGEPIPALGHSWSEWEVTKHATEEEDGAMQRVCSVCGAVESGVIPRLEPKPTANPFTDVYEDQYYYAPVLWAVNHTPQITNGTSANTFSPDATCTRDQIVTFLWRAMGCPEPTSTNNPFVDVKPGDYFYKPVLWAVEKGITNGMDLTHFGPTVPCSRAHVVTFLWRAHEKPAAGTSNPFVDVSAGQYYTDAVLWAVSKNITNGMDATHFGPDAPCQRGQIVTFLYRDMK